MIFSGAHKNLAASSVAPDRSGNACAAVHDVPYWIPVIEAGWAAAGNKRRRPDDCSQYWQQNRQLLEQWVGWPHLRKEPGYDYHSAKPGHKTLLTRPAN